MQQLFNFGFEAELREDDFIVSDCNRHAFMLVSSWPKWDEPVACIYGPKACGKSHLAQIWKKKAQAMQISLQQLYDTPLPLLLRQSDAFIVENIEDIYDEVTFLHFFNSVKEKGKYLLFTTDKHPSLLGIKLPDLSSRLKAVPTAEVEAPDDGLLGVLFQKHFSDRQLKVGKEVIDFLVSRTERSFPAMQHYVDLIDNAALQKKRNITVPFVKEVIGAKISDGSDRVFAVE